MSTSDPTPRLAALDLGELARAAAAARPRKPSPPPPVVPVFRGAAPGLRGRVMTAFPRCRAAVGVERWDRVARALAREPEAELAAVPALVAELGLPAFLADLARLELAIDAIDRADDEVPETAPRLRVNPTLALLDLDHPVAERVLVWRVPGTRRTRFAAAAAADLLALVLADRGVTEDDAAAAAGVAPDRIARAVDAALRAGVVVGPRPGIRRDPAAFPIPRDTPEELIATRHFTLQWHLTNSCDLDCRHCYDRTRMEALPLDRALAVLDDFVAFCRRRRLRGELCLTGGNPLLYPRFKELYRAVAATGLPVSFLGNPTRPELLDELIAIRRPESFQISLEGLEPYNDEIRGRGSFARALEFLALLRERDVFSVVMLTLGRGNLDQVLPLAELLRDRADSLTFNRLAQVGEGAALAVPEREAFAAFLDAFEAAARGNPVLQFKDNLFNIGRHEHGQPLVGGCTGFGCGAAFNFFALLPTGEAHACRKFPSPIGDVLADGIEGVYQSAAARRYRSGSAGCRSCPIRVSCGGCMAVAHGAGLDPFVDVDPHCFFTRARSR